MHSNDRRATRFWFIFLLLVGFLTAAAARAETIDPKEPDYIGSQRCGACHKEELSAWRGSHHDLAWTYPQDGQTLAPFSGETFSHKGVVSRFYRDGDRARVSTDGPDGKQTEYDVKGVVGISPLQQYLVEIRPGRLQALDTAWDALKKRWYHLYPDQDLPSSNGLHWTGPYKSWDARCAECHATGFKKAYDTNQRTYKSTQAEIGVGCEACHGPGQAHAAWANKPASFKAPAWSNVGKTGLTMNFSVNDASLELEQCAVCHSRRSQVGADTPTPGSDYDDHYGLSLLRNGLYHPDGQILEEVYVYGSFLQSKMNQKGVRCSNCHEPHSATLKAEGNVVCTQCHSPAGNPSFPTLKKATYDSEAHHFHKPETPGAACVSCHMRTETYMGIDKRRDHSFQVPRPDLSEKHGVPNACSDCHSDKSANWAALEIKARFPQSRIGQPHFADILATAWQGIPVPSKLLVLAADKSKPPIVRASALTALASVSSEKVASEAVIHLSDPDPLVRRAAIAVQRGANPQDRVVRLIELLDDPVRTVRIEVARSLLDARIARLPERYSGLLSKAMDDYKASLKATADFPGTQMALAGVALTGRQFDAANAAFREAIEMDPQLEQAWIMLARIQAAFGRTDEAISILEKATRLNPGSISIYQTLNDIRKGEKN